MLTLYFMFISIVPWLNTATTPGPKGGLSNNRADIVDRDISDADLLPTNLRPITSSIFYTVSMGDHNDVVFPSLACLAAISTILKFRDSFRPLPPDRTLEGIPGYPHVCLA